MRCLGGGLVGCFLLVASAGALRIGTSHSSSGSRGGRLRAALDDSNDDGSTVTPPTEGRGGNLDPDSLSQRQAVKLKPEVLTIADPAPKITNKKEIDVEDMLRELREIQGIEPRNYCILGTRHCSYLHEQIIELLSYALVLSGNHVYTSGSSGTNAAAIRGALRAGRPPLLTVVLPQSLTKQKPEAKELIVQVTNVVEMPENDHLPLEVASRRCNSRLISLADNLVAFAFHESMTVVAATIEAEAADKIVTVMYLD